MTRPSAFELWEQAGGETDAYDPAEYRRLMVEHGLLVPGPAKPLPCGWAPGSNGHPVSKVQDGARGVDGE